MHGYPETRQFGIPTRLNVTTLRKESRPCLCRETSSLYTLMGEDPVANPSTQFSPALHAAHHQSQARCAPADMHVQAI